VGKGKYINTMSLAYEKRWPASINTFIFWAGPSSGQKQKQMQMTKQRQSELSAMYVNF